MTSDQHSARQQHVDHIGQAVRFIHQAHPGLTKYQNELLAHWMGGQQERLSDLPEGLQGLITVAVAECWLLDDLTGEFDSRNILGLYLSQDLDIERRHLRFLRALAKSPMRLYQVSRVNIGKSFAVVDLLSSAQAMSTVIDPEFSKGVVGGEILGMRIVNLGTHNEISPAVLWFEPAELGPLYAELESFAESGELNDVKLSDTSLAMVLGPLWCGSLFNAQLVPKVFDPATGDPAVLIEVRYEVSDWVEVERRLNNSGWLALLEPMNWACLVPGQKSKDPLRTLAVSSSPVRDQEMLASVRRDEEGRLLVFCQSDSAAGIVENGLAQLLGQLISRVGRTAKSTDESMTEWRTSPESRERLHAGDRVKVQPDDMQRLVEQMNRSTYEDWAEHPIPMLNNKTPRECRKDASGQERVRALIKGMETNELELAKREGRKPISLKFVWESVGLKKL